MGGGGGYPQNTGVLVVLVLLVQGKFNLPSPIFSHQGMTERYTV